MTRLITKQMRDSFNCKKLKLKWAFDEISSVEFFYTFRKKKQRILILKVTIK